jgi:hypothetical protein
MQNLNQKAQASLQFCKRQGKIADHELEPKELKQIQKKLKSLGYKD